MADTAFEKFKASRDKLEYLIEKHGKRKGEMLYDLMIDIVKDDIVIISSNMSDDDCIEYLKPYIEKFSKYQLEIKNNDFKDIIDSLKLYSKFKSDDRVLLADKTSLKCYWVWESLL